MAAGDILSVEIGAEGWFALVTIDGLTTGGTYDLGLGTNNNPSAAKIEFTVTSLGFDDTGAGTTIERTIYGTKEIRKPYPNQAEIDETDNGTSVTLKIALSDYIYSKDKSGVGNSGTDVTVNIASSFYTQGGTPNNASSALTCTNSSTAAYPTVIANWSWPGYERITGPTFSLRAVAFHRSAQQGKPVRCIKFTATDESANSVSTVVTTPTRDVSVGDAIPVVEYVAQLSSSSLIQAEVVTCRLQAYPWIGDADSVADSSTSGFTYPSPRLANMPLICDKNETYGVTIAVVDPSGNDTTGAVVSTDDPETAALTPFLTIGKAAAAIAAYNNTNRSRNDVGAGKIYIKAGSYNWVGSTNSYGTTPETWLTITRYPGEAISDVIISGQSGNSDVSDMIRLYELRITSSASITFNGVGSLWFDKCEIASTGAALVYGTGNWWVTRCTITAIPQGLRPYSTQNTPLALLRGCSLSSYTGNCMSYTTIGNTKSGLTAFAITSFYTGMTQPAMDAMIIAYNNFLELHGTSTVLSLGHSTTIGVAVVQNIFESTNVGLTGALIAIWADGNVTDCTHVIVWHNTLVGQRLNAAYNDTGSAAIYRKQWSIKYNIVEDWNIKTDTYTTANGARIGNWPILYGVGMLGNLLAKIIGIGADGFLCEFPGLYTIQNTGDQIITYCGFIDRKARTGSGSGDGNGNYNLLSTSPAVDFSNENVLNYDLAGVIRSGSIDAGVYEYINELFKIQTGFFILI